MFVGTSLAVFIAIVMGLAGVSVAYLTIIRPEFQKFNYVYLRQLTDEEKEILVRFIKVKRIWNIVGIVILVFVCLVSLVGVIKATEMGIISFFVIFVILLGSVMGKLTVDNRDFKNGVFRLEGEVTKVVGGSRLGSGSIWDFKVGKYSFRYSDIPTEVSLKIAEFESGDNIQIDFSPRTHVIWGIKKIS